MQAMDQGIISTPIITQLYPTHPLANHAGAGRQIVLSTIQRQLTILDSDGHHLPGNNPNNP